jgi:isoquinoline 1-oxidoreductase alpha subunit
MRKRAVIKFRLNDVEVVSSLEPDTPLLWAVRDEFKLKGSKFGCGAGLCGACTMHVDGVATRTCILPLAAVDGRAVTTIEGLGTPEALHPLQAEWVRLSVPQCGYCQSGQIMTAAALLAENPQPGEHEVEEAMAGNICRCGCYPRIKQAILNVANTPDEPAATQSDLATEVTS